MISISIEANKIAASMDMDTEPSTVSLPFLPSADSEDIKSLVRSQMRRSFPDSDEDTDTDDGDKGHHERSKRLAITPSDDASDTNNHFTASASTSPRKKAHTTGGQSPMVNE